MYLNLRGPVFSLIRPWNFLSFCQKFGLSLFFCLVFFVCLGSVYVWGWGIMLKNILTLKQIRKNVIPSPSSHLDGQTVTPIKIIFLFQKADPRFVSNTFFMFHFGDIWGEDKHKTTQQIMDFIIILHQKQWPLMLRHFQRHIHPTLRHLIPCIWWHIF